MPAPTASWTSPRTLDEARSLVRDLLGAVPSFGQMGPEEQRALAQHMVEVIWTIASPGGSGAGVNEVDSPEFVVRLIEGVFQAIVESSIEQMRAYAELLADIAKSLDPLAADDGTGCEARDWLTQRYPDTLAVASSSRTGELGATRGPRAQLVAKGEDPDRRRNLGEVSRDLGLDPPVTDISDPDAELRLVNAARLHRANARRQHLSSMVFGINRIVVTDGNINAKTLAGPVR